jgi:uncharacterized protein
MADTVGQLRALYDALLSGRFDEVATYLGDDFVVRSPESLPYGGEKRGVEGLGAMFAGFGESWADPQFAITAYTGNDDLAVAHIDLKATSRRTGAALHTQVVETWRMAGGKFVEMQAFYADAGRAAALLG